jgi:hypothetical protein
MNKNPPAGRPALDAHGARRRRLLGTALAVSTTPFLLTACNDDGSSGSADLAGLGGDSALGAVGSGSSTFTVQNRKILLDGSEFFAKGVCYSPVPIGATADTPPGGDFFSDFWEPLFTRDLSALQNMGCNSVRLYMVSPWATPWDSSTARQYHTKFMDACAEKGIYVWLAYPMTPDQAMSSKDRPRIEQGYQLLCEELGAHPALIGFTIGNETDNNNTAPNPDFWAWMDGLAEKVKGWAPGKLTKCAVHDVPTIIDDMINVGKGVPHLDVIGLNSYRGTKSAGFDTMFTDYDAKFKAAGLPDRPFLVTEFGCPASTRQNAKPVELPDNALAQADYIEAHWRDIVRHHGLNLCSGGYLFEWSDEWWKAGNITQHDGHSSCGVGQFPGGCPDEEWYGINSIAVGNKDDGTPRPAADPVTKETRNGADAYVHHPDILTPRAGVERLKTLWAA